MPGKLRSLLAVFLSFAILTAAVAWQNGNPPAEPPAPPSAAPTFWKGNLHTHSLWSDGDDFPEMIADWYKRRGYHFLTLSDHNVLSEGERWIDIGTGKYSAERVQKYLDRFGEAWVERRKTFDEAIPQVRLKPLAEFRSVLETPGKFLLIPGEEVTHRFVKKPVHMNAVNLRDVILPANGANVAETIAVNLRAIEEQRKKKGWKTLAFLNHPNFGWGVKAEDMLGEELRYFEIFNGHPAVANYGDKTHVSAERMWDIVLALRLGKHQLPLIYGVATDDAHNYHAYGLGKANPGRGWIMVRSTFLTAESIVRAVEAGDYYCSTGVVLKEVRRAGKDFTLVIQGEKDVQYKTEFIATMKDASLKGEPLLDETGAALDATRRYTDEIGKVVAHSESLTPAYRMTGQEWYVRARITSTKPHPNPYQKGDVEVVWTQPIVP